ncbi:MAG: hypothetical protein IJ479_09165 [Alphaproteobacteria bacterium]|nr:hypothetical protein [Alphaproteobacteria bacterium]
MVTNSNLESANQSNQQSFSYADLQKYKTKIEGKDHVRDSEIKRFLTLDVDKLSETDKKKIIALLNKKIDYGKSAVLYNLLLCKIANSHNDTLKAKALPFAKKYGVETLLTASREEKVEA